MIILKEKKSLIEGKAVSYEDMTNEFFQMLKDDIVAFNRIQIQLIDGDALTVNDEFKLSPLSQLNGVSLSIISRDKNQYLIY
jgi:hypothetical protein